MLLQLSPGASEPLYRQLYREVRSAVLAGRLTPGARLPSTRSLAADLGVSRNTVLQAFEQLGAEGFLESRVGFGTRVARTLPDLAPPRHDATDQRRAPAPTPRLSRRGKAILAVPLRASLVDGRARAFRPGTPALEEFPKALWGRLLSRRWSRSGFSALDYGDAAGYRPLREAIARYVALSRGVRCDADQVLVVSGSQQALDLIGRVLLDPATRLGSRIPDTTERARPCSPRGRASSRSRWMRRAWT